ncbi:hypothetical protein GCM10025783_00400 [Amnibacterium soli]|uniref:Uncharacterized protein n=2 Tax=Amnibacterium soli TaxID=1282736 RepID=A0ABP8YMQ5_9MICO
MQHDEAPAAGARREFPGASAADDALLRHIMTTGGLWSAAAAISATIGLTGLLVSGWRPHQLEGVADPAWWAGAVLAVVGALALAWAGGPVVTDDPAAAARRKSVSVRAGLVVFVAGMAVAALAVLLG